MHDGTAEDGHDVARLLRPLLAVKFFDGIKAIMTGLQENFSSMLEAFKVSNEGMTHFKVWVGGSMQKQLASAWAVASRGVGLSHVPHCSLPCRCWSFSTLCLPSAAFSCLVARWVPDVYLQTHSW